MADPFEKFEGEILKRKFGTLLPLRFEETDSVDGIGKLTAEASRTIARVLATQFALNPGTYDVDIKITMEEV